MREVRLPNQKTDAPLLPMATQPLAALEDILHPENEPKAELVEDPSDEEDHRKVIQRDAGNLETPLLMKRKAIEIADSDDDQSDAESEISLPPVSVRPGGFQPSSQIPRTGLEEDDGANSEASINKARKTDLESNHSNRATRSRVQQDDGEDDDDEMLLETYESKVPSFSQAAAEMSEPLTPSDDERDLS